MNEPRFRVERLAADHDRSTFACGSQPLDRYLHEQASQDERRSVAACYVAADEHSKIAGYYTLAASSVDLTALPAGLRKKLPRYPTVPAVLMGRLAVSKDHQGIGLGAALLADAIDRWMRMDVAAYALLVDAKDDVAAAFYAKHGFLAFEDSPRRLFLPVATAKTLQARTG